MKSFLKLLVCLYPAPWRQRYQAEFGALLEDVNPTWLTLFDVLRGGITMQLKMLTGWKIISLMALLGIVGGLMVSHEMRDEYASSAAIKIELDPSSKATSAQIGAFVKRAVNDKVLSAMVEQYHLYPELRAKDPLKSLVQMKKDIRIQATQFGGLAQPHPPNGIVVQFSYYDKPLSQRVCSALVSKLMEGTVDPAINGIAPLTLELLYAPSFPNGPIYPNRPNIIITGLLAGIVMGLSIAFIRRRTPKPA